MKNQTINALIEEIEYRQDGSEYLLQRRRLGSRSEKAWETLPEEVSRTDRDMELYDNHPFDLSSYEYRTEDAPPEPRLQRNGFMADHKTPRVDLYEEDGSYLSHRSLRYVHAMFAMMTRQQKEGIDKYVDSEKDVEGTNGSAGNHEVSFHSNGDISVGCQTFDYDEVAAFVKANPLPKDKRKVGVAKAIARR